MAGRGTFRILTSSQQSGMERKKKKKNPCILCDNVEKCGRIGQATDGNIIRRINTSFWITMLQMCTQNM